MKTFPVIALLLLSCSLAFGQVKIVTSSPLPNGTVQTPYSVTIQTAGGTVPFAWSSQTLPSGLALTPSADTRSVTLTGTPTKAATRNFDITVEGHGGHVSTVAYSLTIQTQGSHVVDLTWNAGASGVVGYNLYRGTTHGGPYSQINTSMLPTNTFNDSSVENGNTYYYVATEINSEGQESSYSDETEAVVP